MLLAAKEWFPEIAEYLILHNIGDYYGRQALHWAAHYGGKTLASLLLHRGADPNAADRWGRTPLTWAVASSHRAVVDVLLGFGANVTWTAQDECTALHMAAFVGDKTISCRLL